jgi:hypothetical protein
MARSMVVGSSGVPEATLAKGRESDDIGLCSTFPVGVELLTYSDIDTAAQCLEED